MKTKIKNIKNLLLLAGIYLVSAPNVNAREPEPFKYDTSPFIGKWEAKAGEQTFELIISKGVLYLDSTVRANFLFGEMTYKTDGKITRHIMSDGLKSMVSGLPSSPSVIDILYNDDERDVKGHGTFTLDPENLKKATWKLDYRERLAPIEEGEEPKPRNHFDIPTELEWTKIE